MNLPLIGLDLVRRVDLIGTWQVLQSSRPFSELVEADISSNSNGSVKRARSAFLLPLYLY